MAADAISNPGKTCVWNVTIAFFVRFARFPPNLVRIDPSVKK